MPSLTVEMQEMTLDKFGTDLVRSYAQIRDGEVFRKTGVIQPVGVLPRIQAADAGILKKWSAFTTASDIGLYRSLFTSSTGQYQTRLTTFSGTPIPTGEQVIEEYATVIGAMDDVSVNGSTEELAVRAKKDVPGTQVCKVRVDVYHRTTGGTETLLAGFTTPELTSGFANYAGDVTFTRSWATDERLVVKFVGINLGIPP